mmetsp:Transcript_30438/g.55582  ORF Transcript_30438/g.55582 Transcript_30438/m.55582 type:complete len:196 (-) Transcript_30438:1661-2248(-)
MIKRVFVFFLLLTAITELYSSYKNNRDKTFTLEEIDGNRSLDGRVHISYCKPSHYKASASEIEKKITQQFENVEVETSHYPSNPFNETLSRILFVMQIFSVGFIGFARAICGMLGVPVPTLYIRYMYPYKAYILAFTWFSFSVLQNRLLLSRAFEIFINGKLAYSKLESGVLPTADQALDLVRKYLDADAMDLNS